MQAAAPILREELTAVAAREAAEAAEGAAVAAIVSPSKLVEETVLGTLLKLARDIRRPCPYIGYSAFICFCLSRGCRAYFWEGGDRIDLLGSYAPWAIERCTNICAVDGVCCCLVQEDEVAAVAAMMPVSETHPLDTCSHFVAAVPCLGICSEGGRGLQGYYSSKGVAVLGTVMEGDCGIDVACQMLGLPQTIAQRAVLREEISDYLLTRLNTPWMQELMGTLQEVGLVDVRQILREPAAVASGGTTAVAVAYQDTAIAVADQDTAVAVADQDTAAAVADQDTAVAVSYLVLRREAIEWATKSKYPRFTASVVDTLQPSVLDEQVRLHQASKCGPVVPTLLRQSWCIHN